MRPFTPLRLDHLVLRVADLERSIAFYRDVLGCTLERRRDDLGLVHLRAGASQIDLVALDGPLGRQGGAGPAAEGRNLDHLCLRIEPFDAERIVQHLHAAGAPPLQPVQSNFGADGQGPALYLRDPDGNVVELKGPPETARAG